jgi:hypothetical protein
MPKVMTLVAVLVVAGACSSTTSSAPAPASDVSQTQTSTAPGVELVGTWVADVTAGDIRDTLAGGEMAAWADTLSEDLAAPVTLTIDGDEYTVEVGDQAVNGGGYELDGATLKLEVEPNGLTLLDAQLDGDDLTFAFTSNSTQDYPPDTAPEEAVQRALFTSAPFVRS